MLFFRNRDHDPEAEARRSAGMAALTRGDITPEARARIASGMRASTLSCNAFLLTRGAGFEPLGVVMGSAFHTLGIPTSAQRERYVGELRGASDAHRKARVLALDRLRAEASALGAHGVVGVRLTWKKAEWSLSMMECTAIGTAIRLESGGVTERPFTSNLSGEDFWRLHGAGYIPRDLVFGASVYMVSCDTETYRLAVAPLGAGGRNQEIPSYTMGLMEARRLATSRLAASIASSGGAGGVGMEVAYEFEEMEYELGSREYLDLLITFTAVGTSVLPRAGGGPVSAPAPLICHDLASGSTRTL